MDLATHSKINAFRRGLGVIGLVLTLGALVPAQAPVGTAFTYQGLLTQSGSPADGPFDFQFSLYNAVSGGAKQGATLTLADLAVSNGRFTAELDFGATVFNGEARWLEVAVRPGASTGAYTALAPRQQLRPAPYALSAQTARSVPWSAIIGAPTIPSYTAGAGLMLGGGQFSVLFGGDGTSTTAARADHGHDARYYDKTLADGRFLHKAGPETLLSTSTQAALSVTQAGTGTGGVFTSKGYTGVYGATSHAASPFKSQAWGPEQVLYLAYPAGVLGEALNGGYGVWGRSSTSAGVAGIASSTGNGVEGRSQSGLGGYFHSNAGQALHADGSATVTTNLAVGGTITTAQIKYSTPRIHYLAIPCGAFLPTSNVAYSNYGAAYLDSGSGAMSAPVYLPDGATITGVRFVFYDNSASNLNFTFNRYRFDTQVMGELINVTTTGTPGRSWIDAVVNNSNPNAKFPLVDNAQYNYVLKVYCNSWSGTELAALSVRIAYTLPEAQ